MPESLVEQLDHIFKPESIAIIGASNSPGKWGEYFYETMCSMPPG